MPIWWFLEPRRERPPDVVDDLMEMIVGEAEPNEQQMMRQQMRFDQRGQRVV